MDFFTDEEIDALSGSVVRCDFLVEMQFRSETVRVWNGHTQLVAGSQTWQPVYGMGLIEGLEYQSGEQSEAITLRLAGVPTSAIDILGLALEETPDVTQQFVKVYLQLFSEDWQTFGNPISIWYGFMQPPEVERTEITGIEGPVQIVSVTAENAFFNRARPAFGRFTYRDQQRRSPGDRFFSFAASLKAKRLTYPDY